MKKETKLIQIKNLGEETKEHFKIEAYSKENVLQGVCKLRIEIKEPNFLLLLNYKPMNKKDTIFRLKVTSDLNDEIVSYFLMYLKENTTEILTSMLGTFKAKIISRTIKDAIDIKSGQIKIPKIVPINNKTIVEHLPDEKWYGLKLKLPDNIQKEFLEMLK